jgi:hypothetical protein
MTGRFASPPGHPRFFCSPWPLTMSAVVTPGWAIGCLAAHDAKAMRAILLASRRRQAEGLGLDELLRKGSQRVVVRLAMIEDRMRAHDKQFLQISMPILETRPSRSLPPDEFCLGVSPIQGGELARARESGGVLNARGHRRGRHRAQARNGHQPARHFSSAGHGRA